MFRLIITDHNRDLMERLILVGPYTEWLTELFRN